MATYLLIMSVMTPVLVIAAFIVGYNINASKKILAKEKKRELTDAEKLLQRIEEAHI